jgi:predicted adenine nucleotide alpha hydrolase (AANH) superfamily ATPase
MRLLFHCCCAPCSLSCLASLASLRDEGVEPEFFWYNPNIHPYTEYKARRDAMIGFAAAENLKLEMADEYGLRPFIGEVFPDIDTHGGARCEKCYRMRLEKTAAAAAQKGCDSFSSSLLVSTYQNHDAIRRTGEALAAQYGVRFFYRDFRPFFREGQGRARTRGLYLQKYCGCIFSEEDRYRSSNER